MSISLVTSSAQFFFCLSAAGCSRSGTLILRSLLSRGGKLEFSHHWLDFSTLPPSSKGYRWFSNRRPSKNMRGPTQVTFHLIVFFCGSAPKKFLSAKGWKEGAGTSYLPLYLVFETPFALRFNTLPFHGVCLFISSSFFPVKRVRY